MASIQHRPDQNKAWTVRWREGSKHRRRSFRLKSEAKMFLAEAERSEAEQKAGTWQAPPEALDRTVAEQAEHWHRSRSHLSEGTRKMDQSIFNAWILPYIGDVKLRDVRRQHLESVLAEMVDEGLSSGHRFNVYQKMILMMDHALGKSGHDLRDVKTGTRKRERKIKPLSDQEWERLLEATPDEWRLFMDTLGSLGLRPNECVKLSGEHLDFSEQTVTIRSSKTNQTRTLVLPDHLVSPLRRAYAEQVDCGAETLWPWPNGSPNFDHWRATVWQEATEKAGLEDRVPYDLRHTCASKLIALGATVIDVAEWMGHSKQMTMECYGHLFPGRKPELAKMLSRDTEDSASVPRIA